MKKFRLLSSLLALVMVLSMITVMPASAENVGATAFFCDFENFDADQNTNSAFNVEGMTLYNLAMEKAYGAAVSRYRDGNMAVSCNSIQGHLYIPAPSVITSGKVYIGFEIKGTSFTHLKPYFEAPRVASGDNAKYAGLFLANIKNDVQLFVGTSSTGAVTSGTAGKRDADSWSYVQCIVDLDNDSSTLYLDGEKLGTYNFNTNYTEFHGFSFYAADPSGNGLIDNISLVTDVDSSSKTTVDGNDNTVITVVAPVHGLVGLTKDKIKVTKCGSNDAVTVSSVTNLANKLAITLDGSLEPGCEYRVTFDEYEDIEVYAYDKASKIGYYKLTFDEDDLVTANYQYYDGSGNLQDKTIVSDEKVKNVLETTLLLDSRDTEVDDKYNAVMLVDEDEDEYASTANGTKVSGKVLGSATAGTEFYMLDIIESDIGVEVYEFDCKWEYDNYTVYFNALPSGSHGVDGKTLFNVTNDGKWHHFKIEYDTVNNKLIGSKDGEVKRTVTGVSSFNDRVYLMVTNGQGVYNTQASRPVLKIDNYEQYVTGVTPLAVEKVRYTAGTDVTGANTISPATNKIDITFSETVDSAVANAITLTANGIPVETTATSNGNVVTLTIPANSLPGNADIALTIPAVNRTWNVKTSKVDVKVGSLVLEDAESSGSMSANDTITVTASNVTANGSANITLIYAFYKDNELVAVDRAVKAVDGNTPSVNHTFTIAEDFTYDEAKAFVWDGLTTRVPLIPSYTVPAE